MQEALLDFIGILRRNGVRVSTAEAMDGLSALRLVPCTREPQFRSALRATLIKQHIDTPTFEELFDRHFWGLFRDQHLPRDPLNEGENPSESIQEPGEPSSKNGAPPVPRDPNLSRALADMDLEALTRALLEMGEDELRLLVAQAASRYDLAGLQSQLQQNFYAYGLGQAMGVGNTQQDLERLRETLAGIDPGAAADIEELLRKRLEFLQKLIREAVQNELEKNRIDYRREFRVRALAEKSFNAMTLEELAEMRHLVARLAQKLKNIMSLRLRRSGEGHLNMPATLRANMENGGIPFDLRFRRRHRIKPELVVLCDISDSVRYVSRFMLQLAYSLQEIIAKVHSYVFVAQLGETTELFRQHEIHKAIDLAYSGAVINMFSHSNYGMAFAAFAQEHMPAVGPRTTVMVIGDARNNYFEPREGVLKDIRRRAKEVIWLNPESEVSWGLGDSEMPLYAKHCDRVWECRNLKQLEKVVHRLLRI